MAIVDVRIDDRLVHGQVCSNWIPYYSLDRIVIVDDEISQDEQRKAILKLGCAGRCKLSVFDAVKAADKFSRGIDEGIRVMILCNRPRPLVQMMGSGFKVDHVTVGNMSTKQGARQIHNNTFVSLDEARDFGELVAQGIPIWSWIVPTETRKDITSLFEAREG